VRPAARAGCGHDVGHAVPPSRRPSPHGRRP
jgi:hypothetical protein